MSKSIAAQEDSYGRKNTYKCGTFLRSKHASQAFKLLYETDRVYLSSRCTFKYIRCASHRSRTRVEWEHIPRVERLHHVQQITYVSWQSHCLGETQEGESSLYSCLTQRDSSTEPQNFLKRANNVAAVMSCLMQSPCRRHCRLPLLAFRHEWKSDNTFPIVQIKRY